MILRMLFLPVVRMFEACGPDADSEWRPDEQIQDPSSPRAWHGSCSGHESSARRRLDR